ncbi:MAG: CD225/dispanin family protein [Actinomycetota bacterium]|nr:CD225/dispanin family protein [Actinomycetota bacterium]
MTDLQPQTEAAAPPRSFIWWSIAATALCFAPLGIVAIWFSFRTLRAIDHDDLAKAKRSSRVARRWLIAAVVVGFIINLTLLVIFGLMGAFST